MPGLSSTHLPGFESENSTHPTHLCHPDEVLKDVDPAAALSEDIPAPVIALSVCGGISSSVHTDHAVLLLFTPATVHTCTSSVPSACNPTLCFTWA